MRKLWKSWHNGQIALHNLKTLLNVFFVYSENKPRNALHTIVAHFIDLNGSLSTYDLLQHNPRNSSELKEHSHPSHKHFASQPYQKRA